MTINPNTRQKNWIRPLPERLINKIAAGEVIERPAAVLKELVENSLDAGATRIEVIIEKSGMKSISVLDNGCGINPDQVEIAFSRHATSKIKDFSDLDALRSYGFRGEALPSIGSVSRTRMVSKTGDTEEGREIIIEGGVVQSVKPIGVPDGTKVEVEKLFFNTPARRKFLKSESTEARHLTRTATAMALGALGVRFDYTINGKHLFSIQNENADLQSRVKNLLLMQGNIPLFELDFKSDTLDIQGYLTYPDNCRQNRYGLYLFINGRYIYSPVLNHGVTSGYGELLPHGKYPVGAVFLDIDPSHVDVNVHPTKAEVRLSEERQIHDILRQSVKAAIRSAGDVLPADAVDSEQETARRMISSEAVQGIRKYQPSKMPDSVQDDLRKLYGSTNESAPAFSQAKETIDQSISADISLSGDISRGDQIQAGGMVYLGQISDLYLVFNYDSELLIIDQHAAHERVLYEEFLKMVEAGGAISQNLLFPINIELPTDQYAVYEESKDILKSIGFLTEPFGTRTILLSAVPTVLKNRSPEKMIFEILSDIEGFRKGGFDIKKAVAQSTACRAAVMAGDKLTAQEAIGLIRALMNADDKLACPHGRPLIFKISKNELDRKFGRK
jgi:DNA mismatch repair protein MutL